jgi:hypothetical protein
MTEAANEIERWEVEMSLIIAYTTMTLVTTMTPVQGNPPCRRQDPPPAECPF